MSELIANNVTAIEWIAETKRAHARTAVFGRLEAGVIWSDAVGPDGVQLVPIDPLDLVAKINSHPFPMLKGHDPGFPVGQVLAAAHFLDVSGMNFVAAVFGLYSGTHISFRHDLEVEVLVT